MDNYFAKNNDISFISDFFDIKTSKDLKKLIGYAAKIYLKALKNELNRVNKEFKDYL